jgi:hypothetical protein
MGVGLRGKHGSEDLGWTDFGMLLELAQEHGWQPEGTAPPYDWGIPLDDDWEDKTRGRPWEGGYSPSESSVNKPLSD